ncbi:MAG: hypothetical protein DIU68_012345 [Chloroflexota bacterium]|nr:MAG: hypothetical protein DIU68_00605 [Chloroflexota bacterium]
MFFVEHSDYSESSEPIMSCPVCQKLFLEEKQLYRHIVQAHQDGEYMSYTFQADLYERWQERIPRQIQ